MLGNLAALVALTPSLVAPGALLAPSEPAPTGVTVAWSSTAHTGVVVTWQETGDARDRVEVVHADGTPVDGTGVIVEAGQPNQSTLPSLGPDQTYRVTVVVVDADGTAISDPGSSSAFDTDRPPTPVWTTVVPHVDGTITMSWRAGAYHDATPGDPLDLPAADPPQFEVFASVADFNDWDTVAGPTSATTLVVSRAVPVKLDVRAVADEWGTGAAADPVEVRSSRVTASIPHTATTGGKLTVTGTAFQGRRACDPGPCWTEEDVDSGRLVRLESRTGAGAAWQTVASTHAAADGKFTFRVTFPGTRDYRVVEPPLALSKTQTPLAYAETPVTTVRGVTGGGSSGGGGGGDDGGLPITGAPVIWVAAAGGVLVALGALLMVLGRLRRRSAGTPAAD